MKKIIYLFVVVCASSFIFLPFLAKADGGMFPPDGYYTNETGQKAFIYYADQVENMVISAKYLGNSADFAWVVPTPTKPEIFKADISLFTKLQEMTTVDETEIPSFSTRGFSLGVPEKVEVIEEKTIDIYETAVLRATDDKALARWLVEHNYAFPEDKSYILKEYIDNGWYFAIAKIQNALVGDVDVQTRLAEGTVTPLRFKFQSDKIIYPMKITRLALEFAEQNSQNIASPEPEIDAESKSNYNPHSSFITVILYVLYDSKTTQDMLTTTWANWVGPEEINSLAQTAVGEDWLKTDKKLFLTKMSATINLKNINNDFLITKAENNDVYPIPSYKTLEFWFTNLIALFITIIIGALLPSSLIFILFVILQSFVIKTKWVFLIGIIYESLTCLGIIMTWLIIFFGTPNNNLAHTVLTSGVIGIALSLLILSASAIFFTVKMIKRYNLIFYSKTK